MSNLSHRSNNPANKPSFLHRLSGRRLKSPIENLFNILASQLNISVGKLWKSCAVYFSSCVQAVQQAAVVHTTKSTDITNTHTFRSLKHRSTVYLSTCLQTVINHLYTLSTQPIITNTLYINKGGLKECA